MGILIRGGRIVDAATDTDKTGDIYLEDGIITEIGQKLKKKDGDRVIDAKGKLVMPGIIDLHVHFRDPECLPYICTAASAQSSPRNPSPSCGSGFPPGCASGRSSSPRYSKQ